MDTNRSAAPSSPTPTSSVSTFITIITTTSTTCSGVSCEAKEGALLFANSGFCFLLPHASPPLRSGHTSGKQVALGPAAPGRAKPRGSVARFQNSSWCPHVSHLRAFQ